MSDEAKIDGEERAAFEAYENRPGQGPDRPLPTLEAWSHEWDRTRGQTDLFDRSVLPVRSPPISSRPYEPTKTAEYIAEHQFYDKHYTNEQNETLDRDDQDELDL